MGPWAWRLWFLMRGSRLAAGAMGLALLLLAIPAQSGVQKTAGISDGECLRCHGDPVLGRAKPGERGRTMYVDRSILGRSRHAKIACTGCHAGIGALPH